MNGESISRDRPAIPTDAAFELLADSRRRNLISYLSTRDEPIAVADLIRNVAEAEHGAPFESIADEDIDRIHVTLHHIHLPKLVDLGMVTVDDGQNVVRVTEGAFHELPPIRDEDR